MHKEIVVLMYERQQRYIFYVCMSVAYKMQMTENPESNSLHTTMRFNQHHHS